MSNSPSNPAVYTGGWNSSPSRTIGNESGFASSRSAFFPGATGAIDTKGSVGGAQDPAHPVQSPNTGEHYSLYARRPSATSTSGSTSAPYTFQTNHLPAASFGGSPQSSYGSNLGGGLSKLRRQSTLANAEGRGLFGEDEQDDNLQGDDATNSMADEMDVEMEMGGGVAPAINSTAFGNNASPSRPIHALPYRQRSLSQSTSNNPFVRSSPPWPNSPPRAFGTGGGQQHLLARLASEQQQAAIATAAASISPLTGGSIGGQKSASSGHFSLVPASMRQYTQHMGSGLTTSDEGERSYAVGKDGPEQIDDEYQEYEADQEEEGASSKDFAPRSFNPLNPLSLKPSSSNTSSARPASSSRSSETGNMTMDDMLGSEANGSSGQNDSTGSFGNSVPARPNILSPRRSMSSETMGTMPSLRHSRSSPSLASGKDVNDIESMRDEYVSYRNHKATGQGGSTAIPSTPPPRQSHLTSQLPPGESRTASLRRSVSASHRVSTVGHSQMSGDDTPQTAPAGGTFPPSSPFRRANSFSGRSATYDPNSLMQEETSPQPSRREILGKTNSKREHHYARTDAAKASVPRALSQSSGSDTNASNAAGGGIGSPVRRPVNHRKGSLMPKSKDHLRIMSQLRLETGEFEVASEAALNRISQSTPSYPGFTSPRQGDGRRATASVTSQFGVGPGPNGPASQSPFSSLSQARTAGERGGVLSIVGAGGKPAVPTRNRFPEAAVLDDEDDDLDSSGSEPDYGTAGDGNGGQMSDNLNDDDDQMSISGAPGPDGTMDGSKMSNAWSLRDPSMTSQWAAQNRHNLTPGGTSRTAMEMENSPSSALSWANAVSRPGKRKMNEAERFEPYSSAFKRRAVSPASTSSVSLSPLLTNANSAALPSISHLTSLGPAAQIPGGGNNTTMPSSLPPSPIVNNGSSWWGLTVGAGLSANTSSNNSATNRSRAASPALSVASSVGVPTRKWGAGNGQQGSEEDKKVDFGQMSLG